MRHSTYLEVNLNHFADNFYKVEKMVQGASIMPMIKADAYGNGLIPITQFVNQELKVKSIGCASLSEAIKIYQDFPDFLGEILVFSDVELRDEKIRRAYLDYNIIPVIHNRFDLDLMLSVPELATIPLVLKINTGMNRLGLSLDDLVQCATRLKLRGVRHLMSHFSCSYYPIKPGDKTNRQYDEFKKAKQLLQNASVEVIETSMANSAAIEQGFALNETHVRPGLMLYGPASVENGAWQGNQISRLVTKVIRASIIKKGTPVGYGVHVAGEDCYMVVLPIGYGDGIMTFYSGVELWINGFKAKIFGRVNMDMTFLAFDPSVEGKIREGDVVEFWGHDRRTISDIAAQMNTHPYQIMCAISGRIPRIYKVR
jgi:alanine racemase